MTRSASSPDDINDMADEVARLIAARFGGALPRRLRKQAQMLARADTLCAQPKVARQLDLAALTRSHQALMAHLKPLGELSRWRGRLIGFGASVALGVLVLFAVIVWMLLQRGYL